MSHFICGTLDLGTLAIRKSACGKTAPANVWMYALWKEYQAKTVFMMPTSLFKQNYKSFFKFTDFEEDEIVILRGTPKQRQKLMANPRGKVFITSFNFFAPKGKDLTNPQPSEYEELKKYHNIMAVFVDEWHMGFKNLASRRTQGLLFHLQWIPIMVPLTGTAVDGHLDSVYPMIHAIEPRYYLNHKDFLNQHCVYDYYGKPSGQWKNTEKVKEILARHCIRHSFEEVYGKDETIIEPREFEMSHKHLEAYRAFEDSGLFMTPEGFKECTSGGEMVLRLRQICNCPEYLDEEGFKAVEVSDGWYEDAPHGEKQSGSMTTLSLKNLELTKDEGIEADIETALQTNKKLLIFAAFKPEQKRLVEICRKIDSKIRVALLNGDVAQGKAREKIEDDFREGRLDIVIASPEVVSVGFDWPHLDIVMFYSLDYKDTNFLQGYRRGVRGRREKPLLVYVYYYAGGVEEDVIYIIQGKMKVANQTDPTRVVFDLLKKRNKNLKVGLEEKPASEFKAGRKIKVSI